MDKTCMYCKEMLGINYEYYMVQLQNRKFEPYKKIGYACENCVEDCNCKTLYRLWNNETPPHYGASCFMACS